MTPGIIWITGCASGVGRHLAGAFLGRGWRVIATDINWQRLRTVAAEDGWDEQRLLLKRLDVVDNDAWEAAFRDVIAEWGGLDVMANVAGYLRPGWLLETPREEARRHMDVNYGGVVNGSLIAARHMSAEGRGHIINISSLAGVAAIPGLGCYSASKFAVRAWTLALAHELKPRGVAVTVLCPDAIETPMLDQQVNADEAALTFSGGRARVVGDLEKVLFDRVLTRRPLEVVMPAGRGFQARLGGAFPAAAAALLNLLRRRGARHQSRRRKRP